jgi:hypothetical protein
MKMQMPGFSRPGLRSDGVAPIVQVSGLPLDGLVGYWKFDEGRNLLKYSQQFDNAAWEKTDCAITANDAVAPDGTTTADKIALTVGAAQQLAESVTVTPGETYTYSAWVKLGTATDLKYAVYNVTGSADIIAPTAYGATGEWARYAATFTVPVGCVSVSVRPVKNAAQADGATAWLWGAQLREGTDPGDYYPTTDKQILMDYSRPRKNLLLPTIANGCEDGTTSAFAAWGKGVTLSSSTEQFWQGSRSLKVVCDGTVAGQGQYYQWYTYGLSPGKTYTGSVYVKGTAGATLALNLVERTDTGIGTGGGASVNLTATGGWDRVVATFTAGATGRCANMRVIVNGTLATTFYVDGFQLEEGSVATEWTAPPNIGTLGSKLGTDTNDPTWTGQGLAFETDDYVSLGNGIAKRLAGTPGMTLMVAVKSGRGLTYGGIVGTDTTTMPLRAFVLIDPDGIGAGPGFYIAGNSSISKSAKLNQPLSNTAYSLVTGRFVGGTSVQIRTNGDDWVSNTTDIPPTINLNAKDVYHIGKYATYLYKGDVAAVAVWSRALSDAEVAQAYAYLKGYLAKKGVVLP